MVKVALLAAAACGLALCLAWLGCAKPLEGFDARPEVVDEAGRPVAPPSAPGRAAPAIPGAADVRTVYDAAADFSSEKNPNGVWTYGYAETMGAGLVVFPEHYNYVFEYDPKGTLGWRERRTHTYGGPWLGKQGTGLCFHPGGAEFNRYCVLRFTAPAAGMYEVAARFHLKFPGQGKAKFFVYHNAQRLHEAQNDGNWTFRVEAARGDRLDFIVDPDGVFASDISDVAAVIRPMGQ